MLEWYMYNQFYMFLQYQEDSSPFCPKYSENMHTNLSSHLGTDSKLHVLCNLHKQKLTIRSFTTNKKSSISENRRCVGSY